MTPERLAELTTCGGCVTSSTGDDSEASKLIDATLSALDDWRGQRLGQLRALILEAAPDIREEVKWRKPTNPNGVPVWTSDGIVCTGEIYKDKVKLTFAHGASLADPAGLFNSSLDGKVRRAIDLHEGDELDPGAFKDLVQAAVHHNRS